MKHFPPVGLPRAGRPFDKRPECAHLDQAVDDCVPGPEGPAVDVVPAEDHELGSPGSGIDRARASTTSPSIKTKAKPVGCLLPKRTSGIRAAVFRRLPSSVGSLASSGPSPHLSLSLPLSSPRREPRRKRRESSRLCARPAPVGGSLAAVETLAQKTRVFLDKRPCRRIAWRKLNPKKQKKLFLLDASRNFAPGPPPFFFCPSSPSREPAPPPRGFGDGALDQRHLPSATPRRPLVSLWSAPTGTCQPVGWPGNMCAMMRLSSLRLSRVGALRGEFGFC